MTPAGVHATSFGRFCDNRPTPSAPEAIHIFVGCNRVEDALLRSCAHRFRQRRLDQDAVVHRTSFGALDQRQHVAQRCRSRIRSRST